MSQSKKIKYFLVHHLKISFREAQALVESGNVLVDGKRARVDLEIEKNAEIRVNDVVLNERLQYSYFLFHKPRGIECTRNPSIEGNLLQYIPAELNLHTVGRLDKYSEGLMIVTNDGHYTRHINRDGVEKEYEVVVDRAIEPGFKEKMESGVVIMHKLTKPCTVIIRDEKSFTIILNQGLNRQIRRMCYKCGYEVVKLKRTRIGRYYLDDLKAGELREVSRIDQNLSV